MIVWKLGFEAAIKNLRDTKTAAMICRAVIRFHDHGEGNVKPFGPDHHLRVGGFVVKMTIDRAAETITVLRFFREPVQ